MDKLRLYLEVLGELPADKRTMMMEIILDHVAQMLEVVRKRG